MPTSLSRNVLNTLARVGAQARLAELDRERQSIIHAFPDLSPARRGRPPKAAAAGTPARRGRRRSMSAAERRAVSARMKKYWADRRKAKAKAKS